MPYLAMDYGRQEDSGKLWEYVVALEEERRKIHAFQRELPLCLQLVTHAIETCKQQIGREVLFPGRSDCEATSNEGPVLEEFMPPKRSSCTEDEKPNEKDNESAVKKPDWLRSVQLWSTHDTHPPPPQHEEELREALKPKKLEEAFHIPFSREEKISRTAGSAGQASMAEASSTDRTTGERNHEKGEQTTHRKDRRCWSSELHRSFLQALQQLGGAHVATPKQIRELMRVDGLTNDEVKSHLQKYRLHKRRPSPTRQGDNFPQPAQFIFVGGIWVPPPEYAAAAAAADAAAGSQQTEVKSAHAAKVYAPTAILPQCKQQSSPVGRLSSGGRSSVRDNNAHSSSSATSTSSHTSTLYPTFCIH